MTELETLKHAKEYLDKMVQGVNPLTNREVPEEDLINNVRITRCLVYVSDVSTWRRELEHGFDGQIFACPSSKSSLIRQY